jgi:hypothetical protein
MTKVLGNYFFEKTKNEKYKKFLSSQALAEL